MEVDGIEHRYQRGASIFRRGLFQIRSDTDGNAEWSMEQNYPYCEPCWLAGDEDYYCACIDSRLP